MITKSEKIVKLLAIIDNKSGRIKKFKLECGRQSTQICVLNERIKELEANAKILKDGGYVRHKHNCLMGEYNSFLTGKGCSCGLSQALT